MIAVAKYIAEVLIWLVAITIAAGGWKRVKALSIRTIKNLRSAQLKEKVYTDFLFFSYDPLARACENCETTKPHGVHPLGQIVYSCTGGRGEYKVYWTAGRAQNCSRAGQPKNKATYISLHRLLLRDYIRKKNMQYNRRWMVLSTDRIDNPVEMMLQPSILFFFSRRCYVRIRA